MRMAIGDIHVYFRFRELSTIQRRLSLGCEIEKCKAGKKRNEKNGRGRRDVGLKKKKKGKKNW